MNIIDVNYKWNGTMQKRTKPIQFIVVHHTASTTASVEDIHRWHQEKGWCGIGYNFVVRKDGNVYRGRPLEFVPAHVQGWNEVSIGVCFEGDFSKENMAFPQQIKGIELLRYLLTLYPQAQIKKHRDFGGSDCPGKNFPESVITEATKKQTVDELSTALEKLKSKGIINSPDYWLKNAVNGGNCNGEYVRTLILNIAKS